MESKRRENIWESHDRDLRIEYFINNLVEELKSLPQSKRKTFILEKLRENIEENLILEDKYE